MHNNININVSGPVQPSSQYKTVVLKGNLPLAQQLIEPNTKYVIKHNFDLGGESVIVPEDCVLEFDGGTINNGNLVFNDTLLVGNILIRKSIVTTGTVKNKVLYSDWFDCYKDGIHDDAPMLRNAINLIYNNGGGILYLNRGIYYLNSGDTDTPGWNLQKYSIFKLPNNFCLEGDGDSSILLYNTNRLPKLDSGDIAVGCIFTNNINGTYHEPVGDIVLKNFKVEYTTPTASLDTGNDYKEGQLLYIYFGSRTFITDYYNANVRIENVTFNNIVGHQTIRCDKVKNFISVNNRHYKAGVDTDSANKDYSVYYVNSESFIAHDNIIDVTGTIFETHSENVNIYSNIVLNADVFSLNVGGMTDENGNLREADIKVYDNIVRSTRFFIDLYYYDDTKIHSVECYNNSVVLESKRNNATRYLFSATDSASTGTDYLVIDSVSIHNERIEQKDTTAISIWNRIFKTNNIEKLHITDCTLINLSNYPLLIADNNGKRSIKEVIFSNNKLQNCASSVSFVYPTTRNNILDQSVVVLAIAPVYHYDGTDIDIQITDNDFKDVNINTIILGKDIVNIGTASDPIDTYFNITIRDNVIKSVMPLTKYIYNAYYNVKGNEEIDVEVYNYPYDESTRKLVPFTQFYILEVANISPKSSVKFHFSDGVTYKLFGIGNKKYTVKGIDTSITREVGYVPKGSILNILSNGLSYICINVNGNTPVWMPLIANGDGVNLDSVAPELIPSYMNGYTCLNRSFMKPRWWNGSKWIDERGYTFNRIHGTFLQARYLNLTPNDVGYEFYLEESHKPIYYGGDGKWYDAAGNEVTE